MKLTDFELPDAPPDPLADTFLSGMNGTATAYPSTRTVPELFAEQAAASPDALAVVCGASRLSYQTLDQRSNQVAHTLLAFGLRPEALVGVMLERSAEMVVAILGVLKAGAAYLPINSDYPFERIRYLLRDTQAPVLIGSRTRIRDLNTLQWECPALTLILCPDSDDIHAETEPAGEFGNLQVWDHVASEAFDEISAGGWKSSYTGEWLSREVMNGYGDNVRTKLAPLLNPSSRVLEIGCASGISMFRLAPMVGFYLGTDISPGVAQWAERERRHRGLNNVRIQCLPAHEIDRIAERDFDVVLINSVIECFDGHNYLRNVLAKAIASLGEQGTLFLGNLWNQDTKDAFIESLRRFKAMHPDRGYRTKLDREDELYVAKAFLEDLRFDLPAIRDVVFSDMIGGVESELSNFGYDAMLRIDKRETVRPPGLRHRHQADRRTIARASTAPVFPCKAPRTLAYLIYTSGSSGVPKGVMIEQRSILRLVRNTDYIDLTPGDWLLATGSLAFDASTFEIWGPLLNGACACLPHTGSVADPRVLSDAMRGNPITTVFLTTALFNLLAETDLGFFATLRTVLTGGEKVSVRHINMVRRAWPALRLLHVYGPTEATTFATWHLVERIHERDVPIGRPLANTTAYILDTDLRPVSFGGEGELHIGGDGLARGYWGDPVLTARKFVPHPLLPGERLYRTGDLARFSADGDIEFLGRVDRQVKIRGYRVEPEEVERCLWLHPDVRQVALLCLGDGEDRKLHAYVSGGDGVTVPDLLGHLSRVLPSFMLPAQILVLPELPLNQNGKIDKRALPPLGGAEPARRQAGTPPATETERQLAAIWADVLAVRDVHATDNFFELGGHSLKVPKLASQIQARLDVEIPYMAIYTAETLRELANYIADRRRLVDSGVDPRLAEDAMVPLSPLGDGGRQIFAFPPGSGYGLVYAGLARLLHPHALHAFSFIERPTRCEEYAELMADVDPDGPYTLFGFSGGGKIAFEVAAHLERNGRQVRAVVMTDSARYLEPQTFSDADMRAIAADFLNGVTSAVLKDKAYRKMSAYRAYLGGRVETEVLSADLHVITEAGSPRTFLGPDGRIVATIDGWRDLTRGRFSIQAGAGAHRVMLDPPNLVLNARQLRNFLDRDSVNPAQHAERIA